MKSLRLFFLTFLVTAFVTQNLNSQSLKLKKKFIGTWINTQFEQIKNMDGHLVNAISPQFIVIDSSGGCTLLIRQEQKKHIGKPLKIRTFGDLTLVTFNTKNQLQIGEITNNPDYIVLSCPTCTGEILFRRQ